MVENLPLIHIKSHHMTRYLLQVHHIHYQPILSKQNKHKEEEEEKEKEEEKMS